MNLFHLGYLLRHLWHDLILNYPLPLYLQNEHKNNPTFFKFFNLFKICFFVVLYNSSQSKLHFKNFFSASFRVWKFLSVFERLNTTMACKNVKERSKSEFWLTGVILNFRLFTSLHSGFVEFKPKYSTHDAKPSFNLFNIICK